MSGRSIDIPVHAFPRVRGKLPEGRMAPQPGRHPSSGAARPLLPRAGERGGGAFGSASLGRGA